MIPAVMLIAGYMMKNKPPKEINNVVGYRTPMSKKNMDTWIFAHQCCGRLWVKGGMIMLIIAVIVQIPLFFLPVFVSGIAVSIVLTAELVVLLLTVRSVEKELKKTFDPYGNRR